MPNKFPGAFAVFFLFAGSIFAGVGDPQIKTDHPWYPGELAMSTFDRLAETQAEVYERVTGRTVETDEDKALASWFWRNLHYAHGEEGRADLFGEGFEKSDWNRDYWHGLFAHGFALCGTTHAQWTAEMNSLLGHCRSRAVGVTGHNSFEVFLKGGDYGQGRWALLDHDLSTVVFDENGKRLISIEELIPELNRLGDPGYRTERQRGWRVAGLHPDDINSFKSFRVAEYLAGYAGPPPMVHLRSGETLRRYLEPGLEDGKTFVFWGRNYNTGDVPGPERSRTWVNQPEKMFQAERDAGHVDGRFRYGNAVYTYRPFDEGERGYPEGLADYFPGVLTFGFRTPYVIAATPPDDSDWGIYKEGCKNGLVVAGELEFPIAVSTNCGRTWHEGIKRNGSVDLTDFVKGHQQYWLRLGANAKKLGQANLEIRTVCQINPATIPQLRDGQTRITYQATGRAVASAGPNRNHAFSHVVDGSLDSSSVTLAVDTSYQVVAEVHAASHNRSGSPPDPTVNYRIDYHTEGSQDWKPLVENWNIERRGSEPDDFWSQSFTYGSAKTFPSDDVVFVRFSNDGGKKYRRVEAHVVHHMERESHPVKITFGWTESGSSKIRTASRIYPADSKEPDSEWSIETGTETNTRWVEMTPVTR